jgi:hypothetical protein
MGFIFGCVPQAFAYRDETTLQGKICIGPIIFGRLYVFISDRGFQDSEVGFPQITRISQMNLFETR